MDEKAINSIHLNVSE